MRPRSSPRQGHSERARLKSFVHYATLGLGAHVDEHGALEPPTFLSRIHASCAETQVDVLSAAITLLNIALPAYYALRLPAPVGAVRDMLLQAATYALRLLESSVGIEGYLVAKPDHAVEGERPRASMDAAAGSFARESGTGGGEPTTSAAAAGAAAAAPSPAAKQQQGAPIVTAAAEGANKGANGAVDSADVQLDENGSGGAAAGAASPAANGGGDHGAGDWKKAHHAAAGANGTAAATVEPVAA